MHLCKEYALNATTNTDNTRYIYTNWPLKIFVSVSFFALDLNLVARISRVFKIGMEQSSLFLWKPVFFIKNKYRTFKNYLAKNSPIALVSNKINYLPARLTF